MQVCRSTHVAASLHTTPPRVGRSALRMNGPGSRPCAMACRWYRDRCIVASCRGHPCPMRRHCVRSRFHPLESICGCVARRVSRRLIAIPPPRVAACCPASAKLVQGLPHVPIIPLAHPPSLHLPLLPIPYSVPQENSAASGCSMRGRCGMFSTYPGGCLPRMAMARCFEPVSFSSVASGRSTRGRCGV